MSFKELTVSEFVQAVSKETPTPGGGSVSSLIVSLSAALVSMVGALTANRLGARIEKKSGETANNTGCSNKDSKLESILNLVNTCKELQMKLLVLADKDSAAYDKVIAAYRLPRDTKKEKELRSFAIQDAFKGACLIPLEVVKLSLEVLRLTEFMASYGIKGAMSDVGVACLMAWAGMEGAYLNIKTNLSSIKDESFIRQVEKEAKTCISSGEDIFQQVIRQIKKSL